MFEGSLVETSCQCEAIEKYLAFISEQVIEEFRVQIGANPEARPNRETAIKDWLERLFVVKLEWHACAKSQELYGHEEERQKAGQNHDCNRTTVGVFLQPDQQLHLLFSGKILLES